MPLLYLLVNGTLFASMLQIQFFLNCYTPPHPTPSVGKWQKDTHFSKWGHVPDIQMYNGSPGLKTAVYQYIFRRRRSLK
jgi:hypothetical protein